MSQKSINITNSNVINNIIITNTYLLFQVKMSTDILNC